MVFEEQYKYHYNRKPEIYYIEGAAFTSSWYIKSLWREVNNMTNLEKNMHTVPHWRGGWMKILTDMRGW